MRSRVARQVIAHAVIATFAVLAYARLRSPAAAPPHVAEVKAVQAEPWDERWYSAPIVRLDGDSVLFDGELIASTHSLYLDAPVFRLETLEVQLRRLYPELDPLSPYPHLRVSHQAACNRAQGMRTDRRILCAGHFVVVEFVPGADMRALAQITNSAESLGFNVVFTFARDT